MTIWITELTARTGPKYLAVTDMIAEDISAAHLQPGTKLPPQQDLAWRLAVTVGTVSRAYTEAERQGLVRGEAGRGTYLLRPGLREGFPPCEALPADHINLSLSFPAPGEEAEHLSQALQRIAADQAAFDLLEYQTPAGNLGHRAAGAAWLSMTGAHATAEQVVITNGAQNGILVAFAALTQPGDHILTESLTFPSIKPVARMQGLRMEGLPVYENGLIPETLETAVPDSEQKISRYHTGDPQSDRCCYATITPRGHRQDRAPPRIAHHQGRYRGPMHGRPTPTDCRDGAGAYRLPNQSFGDRRARFEHRLPAFP
jgi:DNA-binding transcriptional MocR family regulator